MKINNIRIQNFRLFKNYEIDFNETLTVLVANNSAGKTALLDIVSITFGSYIGVFPLDTNKGFKFTDATIKKSGDEPLYPISLEATIEFENQSYDIKRELSKKGSSTTAKDTTPLQHYAKTNHTKLIEKQEVDLPIIAYYGTGRLWRKIKKTTTLKESYARSFGYHDCLNPNSNYKEFEEWFLEQSRIEYDEIIKKVQSGKDIDSSELKNINTNVLQNVRESINKALHHIGWKNFRFDGKELVIENKTGISLAIDTFSDGVKSMFALVADIAYRCSKLNPHFTNASQETNGIVLIDEIDMHLHPSWQQKVLKDLQSIFPNIQFIVTSHSPQVLSSISNEHIRIIDPSKEKAIKPFVNPYGKQSIVALEDIMNADATAPRKLANRFLQGILANPKSSWQSFDGKQELKKNLSAIQNGLCAYCEIRLDTSIGNHLEHIDSKSLNAHKTFEYQNIVCSCIKDSLSDNEDTNPISCGHAKRSRSIDIKPTDTECETYFSFDLFGRVVPNEILTIDEKQKAQNTIDILNLNCKRLKRQREAVVDEGYKIVNELLNDTDALNNFLDLELNTINNKYFSFINLRKEHFGVFVNA